MRNTNDKITILQAQQVACMYGEQGLDQVAIAYRMGISQGSVSRLLNFAEKNGWLERTVRFVDENIPKKNLTKIRQDPMDLIKKFESVN